MTSSQSLESPEPVPSGTGSFSAATHRALVETLEVSRTLGFLGPGPVVAHIEHALAHLAVLRRVCETPSAICDLGSGGGVPSLVVAAALKESRIALVDSMAKRCDFLMDVLADFGWDDRIDVYNVRAEEFAKGYREQFDVVTARSFAPPAVTAEIAAGLVAIGGVVVVSAMPDAADHWDADTLTDLGFGQADVMIEDGRTFVAITKLRPCPTNFPRRTGIPAKRPLW